MTVTNVPCWMDDNKNVIQFFRLNYNPPDKATHAIIVNGVKVGTYDAYRYSTRGTVTKADAIAVLSQHVTSTTKGRGF